MQRIPLAGGLRALIPILCALASTAGAQGGANLDTSAPVIVGEPVLTPNSNPAAPLAATLHLVTNKPTQIDLSISDSQRTVRLAPEAGFRTVHDVLVLDLLPGTTSRIGISVHDQRGNRTYWPTPLTLLTKSLPPAFPPLHVTTAQATEMEPGITLLTTFFASPTLPGSGSWIIILDEQGRVVWWYSTPDTLINTVRMRNGHLLALHSPFEMQEIDMLGHIVARWWAHGGGVANAPPGSTIVNVDQFHHEAVELPDTGPADFLCLSTEMRTYPNYPADEVNTSITDPTANVVGDVIVEFNRDGTVVRQTRLLDILDPYRICYGSLASFYNAIYGTTTHDWAHTNAVTYDESDGTYLVSARHQDCVFKIQRSNGQLLWVQGSHDRWNAPWTASLLTPIGTPFEWNFHEHGPHIDANGDLTMFDNGNYRVIPPAQPAPTAQWYSRAVRFHIDPVAMTTEQIWSYDGNGQPFFSGFLGDARPLTTTGHVLVTDGAKLVTGQNKTYARVFEVSTGSPAQKVFEVIVNDPALPSSPYNWNVYRSQRLPSIYVNP